MNLLTNLSYYAGDVLSDEIMNKMDNNDLVSLAISDIDIDDSIWYRVLKHKCGGFNYDYRENIDEFNRYNNTDFESWREAFLGAYYTSADHAIMSGMIDIMWFNFNPNVVNDYILIYLAKMPERNIQRLKKLLNDTQIGSLLTKLKRYDEAYEYFNRTQDINRFDFDKYYDLSVTAENVNENILDNYVEDFGDMYEYYRAWSDNATFEDKLKYGRFRYINEEVDNIDGDMFVKGIKAAIVREEEDIYAFIDRYNQLINLTPDQLIEICKYTDDEQLLTMLLQRTDIDIDVIKWCMYDKKLLNTLSKIVDMYVEDIIDDELIDVTKLVDAGFKLRSNEIVVRGYVLYPPKQYSSKDFKNEQEYKQYMIHRDRQFVMDMNVEDIKLYMHYIVRLYRFDNEVIHKLVSKMITDNDGDINRLGYRLMIETNFRSEPNLTIENDPMYKSYDISILEYIVRRVNIRYLRNIKIKINYGVIENFKIILKCENSSIYRPMLLLSTLVENRDIYNMLQVDHRYYWLLKGMVARNNLRAEPLQYIGTLLGVDFTTVLPPT
jgi:tetratricopeptide (TPR) repeat protein